MESQPQTIIALVYFDMDLYEPTKYALEQIQPYLTKGSVIAFDDLQNSDFPGETIALRETLGLSQYSLKRWQHDNRPSYLVIE